MTEKPPEGLQRLLDEAPFLRLLARALVAGEADEVVQRTWLHAVRHGGDGVVEPRSWLARIARNVAGNLRRGDRRRRQHENAATPGPVVPSSAELMAREEQRHQLVRAVDTLPPPLRTVVLLRFFDGLPPRHIAAQLGLPVTTVGNQLRRALQLLRERLDAEHGGERRAWLLPLVPLALEPRGMPVPDLGAATMAAFGTGAIMTMKTKVVTGLGAAVVAAAAVGLWLANDGTPHDAVAPSTTREAAVLATSDVPASAVPAATDSAVQRSEVVPAAAAADAKTGSLVVHVRWGDDKSPAAGITVCAAKWASDTRVDGARAVTDATGTVRFDELVPQPRLGVKTNRFDLDKPTIVEIRAGETTEVELELPIGLTLTGIVVDAAEVPIAGALIDIAPLGMGDVDAETVATSGADGRFAVRAAPTIVFVGARAEGHAASRLQYLRGKDGNTADVRLQLGSPGGSVDGVVVDERGHTIPGAVVRIGHGETAGIVARGDDAAPLPAMVRSDAQGRFRAVGIPPGEQPVAARSKGRAPWQGTCEVTAHVTTPLRIELPPGASIDGIVRNAAGDAVAKVDLNVGDREGLDHHRVQTNGEGRFRIEGLPAREVVIAAEHDDFGEAKHRVQTEAGKVVECEVRLSTGIELHGSVEDEAGKPAARMGIECTTWPPSWHRLVASGVDGRFKVCNCPEGARLTLTIRSRQFEELRRSDVDPAKGPVRLQLRRAQPASARITGTIAGPDGAPLPNATIYPQRRGTNVGTGSKATGPDGRFETDLLVPGTWTLMVMAKDLPMFVSEPMDLAADVVRDLGTIRMLAGGTAKVTVDGDRTGVRFSITDATYQRWSAMGTTGNVLVSEALRPGDCRLLVSGDEVAAQSIPFTVRAGEETAVAVKLARGVRQQLLVPPPVLDPLPPWVRVRVRSGDALIAFTTITLTSGKPATATLCLAPGDYSLTVEGGDRTLASATFTVGTSEGAPLQLELR